jgi:hypothetical protein
MWTQCDRCEQSHKECVRIETQDYGSRCTQCAKDRRGCTYYLSKGQSKLLRSKAPPPPKALKSTKEEGSSSSSYSSRNFELERMQQELKMSQEDLRISQQQLQLANSRIEAQRDLYEAQLAGLRLQVCGQQGSGKAKRKV